jgi:hypothetical protein
MNIKIASSGRIVPIIDNQDGTFFVVGNARKTLVNFEDGCKLAIPVSGPFNFNDKRFTHE